MNFSIHQASHVGNRRYNQDRAAYVYSNDALLLVLADGMGGHLHGELAAGMAIETFVGEFARTGEALADPQAFITDTMRRAHQRILQIPHDEKSGAPGTTCVAALIRGGRAYWGHAGDSRLYLLRDEAVLSRTRDHSIVHQWLELEIISEEEARVHPQRNQITNCLGAFDEAFYVETGEPLELRRGDVLLLGSDGLWGPFSDRELVAAFAEQEVEPALDALVLRALERERGRSDNITGLALRWGEGGPHETDRPVCHILEIS